MSLISDCEYRRGYWYLVHEPIFDTNINANVFKYIMLAGIMHEVISVHALKKVNYKIQQTCIEGFPLLSIDNLYVRSTNDNKVSIDFVKKNMQFSQEIMENTSIFSDYSFESFTITHVQEMSIAKISSMQKEFKNDFV